jgi:hypothetical protein
VSVVRVAVQKTLELTLHSKSVGNDSDEAIELLQSALPATDFSRPGLLNASDFVVQQLAVAFLRAGRPKQALATVNQYYDVIAAASFHFNINEYFVESPTSTSGSGCFVLFFMCVGCFQVFVFLSTSNPYLVFRSLRLDWNACSETGRQRRRN